MSDQERIVAAAVYHGAIISLPAPARHHTIIQSMDVACSIGPLLSNQGFITNTGRYVNRVEAYGIAYAAKQIISENAGPQLYSEDLW